MRHAFTLLHRWVGLAIAGFLVVLGLTGAVISWDHELDEWLNPHLTDAHGEGVAKDALELAKAIEARDPNVRVIFAPLAAEPGHSLAFWVEPRVDPATQKLRKVAYNQVFVDPATGEELGRRYWGAAWPISTETFVSFLYQLHMSLHVPEMWGIDEWGTWAIGVVAAIWTLDCFVGFYLTLPQRIAPNPARPPEVARQVARGWRARWAPAWRIKTSGSPHRITFDIHRAGGLWTWALLATLAFTGFSLALYREAFYPMMSLVSEVTPSPFESRAPAPLNSPIAPKVDMTTIVGAAEIEAERRGWTEPAGSVLYAQSFGVYMVSFFKPGDDHGAAGVGPAALYLDSEDGRILGDRQPWVGTAADIFAQAQLPLHSGRILGLPGRILISLMGLMVATLSVTGVVIWARKRSARLASRRKALAKAALAAPGSAAAPAARR